VKLPEAVNNINHGDAPLDPGCSRLDFSTKVTVDRPRFMDFLLGLKVKGQGYEEVVSPIYLHPNTVLDEQQK